jgi:hypothetical protein
MSLEITCKKKDVFGNQTSPWFSHSAQGRFLVVMLGTLVGIML